MTEKLPEGANIRQLRIQAKELLRSLPAGSQLAHAQLQIARQYGFESWPKLVAEVETPQLLQQFKNAIEAGDAAALERLLRTKTILRRFVNEPLFSFDSQPLIQVIRHPNAAKLLPILVRYGADPNARSKWWAGGFSALDFASGNTADLLVELGAKHDVWSAAAHGLIGVLSELLEKDPTSVNAPGGDGQRPLHVAANAETAKLLIERGADLEIRDTDHESTPIQYQIDNLPVVKLLLEHGAKPDIFTAIVLDDVSLLQQVLATDPSLANAHIGVPPFVTTKSNGGHIYAYKLGGKKSPMQVAAERNCEAVLEVLLQGANPLERLVAAAWVGDEPRVKALMKQHPDLDIGPAASAVTEAAQAGRAKTVRLLLSAGFDPKPPGMDSGTALHLAAWYGHKEVVQLLIPHVPLDHKDAHHGSTPLGWACHGAQWCRNPQGDYVAVVEALILAGAKVTAPANSGGDSMLTQAGQREDVIAVLKRFL